jgi:LysR family glycine cleavage system transcriptional activator
MEEHVFIVASPALLNGPVPLRTPHDILRHRLLSDADQRTSEAWLNWPAWFAHWDIKGESSIAGMAFNDTRLMNRAAVAGQGIAIGRSVLVQSLLDAGLLVRLFNQEMPAGNGYHFVCHETRRQEPKIAAFGQWLHEVSEKAS